MRTITHPVSETSWRAARTAATLALGLMLTVVSVAAQAPAAAITATSPVTQGQKIVMATHSFNVFIGPNRRVEGDRGPLARLAAEAGKTGHEMLAVQMIGGSTPMQHWRQGDGDDTKNIAKVALRKGGVDVFTMSPNARMPEEGIDLFGDLVRETNPGARMLVQASWSAWDGNGTTASVGGSGAPTSFTNEDHNKATIEQLTAWRNPASRHRVALRAQLDGINARAGLAMKALSDPNDSTSPARELILQQIAWNAVILEPMSGVTGTPATLSTAARTAGR